MLKTTLKRQVLFFERDVLIDYLLGRLSPSDAQALELQAAENVELAQTLETLRNELDLVDRRPSFWGRLFRTHDSLAKFSESRDESNSNMQDAVDSVASNERKVDVAKSKRYAFIPKRVEAPNSTPLQKGLVLKHAAVLTPEEVARRKERAKFERENSTSEKRFIFSNNRYSYALYSHISNVEFATTASARALRPALTFVVGTDSSVEFAPKLSSSADSCFADFISVKKRASINMGRVHSIDALANGVSVWSISDRPSDSLDVCLVQISDPRGRAQISIDSSSDSDVSALYRVFPLEFYAGRSAYFNDEIEETPVAHAQVEIPPVSTASLSEAVRLDERLAHNAPLSAFVPSKALSTSDTLSPCAQTELVPLIAEATPTLDQVETSRLSDKAAFASTQANILPEVSSIDSHLSENVKPQLTKNCIASVQKQDEPKIALQATKTSFSVEPEENENEIGPTLSAEDAYLVELLGREPTAIELDEYYWEDYGAGKASRKIVLPNFVIDAITLITAPPVLIGHITIKFARLFLPRGFSRGEDFEQSSVQKRGKGNQSRFSDMVISMVAGMLIAVCFVFPALRFVVNEIYLSVAESAVRKIGENVSLTQQATEEALLPVMTEHILYPHYNDPNASEALPSDETTYRFDALPEE